MNILLVNYSAFEDGGSSISTYYLAQGLIRARHNVFIASTGDYPGIKTFIFKKFRLLPLLEARDWYLMSFLSKLIKELKIDIIHSAESRFTAASTVKAAKKMRIAGVINYRSFWFYCLKGDLLYKNNKICNGLNFKKCLQCFSKKRWPWEIYKYFYFKKNIKLFNQADANIAVSKTVERVMRRAEINQNTKVVYDPVKIITKFAPKSVINSGDLKEGKEIMVTFIGKLIYHRGISNFLQVAKIIFGKRDNIKFLIVGSGEMRAFCEKFIKEKKIKNVELIGSVKHGEIEQIYQRSDIIFFPSLLPEPFGRIAVEAMAYRKPIIASNLGAMAEIINDGVEGYLVNPHNLKQCAEKILTLAEDVQLRKKMGEAGLRQAQNFSLEKITNEVIKIYYNVVNKVK